MPSIFIVSIFSYFTFLLIVLIAFIAFIISTSKEERDADPLNTSNYLLMWIIVAWPITGLPATLSANDDGIISKMEWMFIVFEILFWFPIIIFMLSLWT